jgi:hypothetical protein
MKRITISLGLVMGSLLIPLRAQIAPAIDLPAAFRDTDACHAYDYLVAYTDKIRPSDLPGIIDQVRTTPGVNREFLLDLLIGRWVKLDPQGALAAARQMDPGHVSESVYQAFYGDLVAHKRAATIAKLKKMPEGLERTIGIWAVVQLIGDDDPAQAQELFNSIHTFNSAFGNHLIYAKWAAKNLDQATKALLQPANFSTPLRLQDAVDGVTDYLLAKSPQAAVNWVKQLPAGKIHDLVVSRLGLQWAQADPVKAIAWLQGISKAEIWFLVPAEWAKRDPQAAIAYATTLPDGQLKTDLITQGLTSWAQADGPSAWAWTQKQPASETRTRQMLNVVTHWALVDPAAAAAKLPETAQFHETVEEKTNGEENDFGNFGMFPSFKNPPNEQAYADVAKTWTERDPAQAAAWIATLPAGSERDAAVVAQSDVVGETDPAKAVALANSIGNAVERNIEVEIQFFRWAKQDPAHAAAAIPGLSVPDEVKKRLTKTTQVELKAAH